MSLSESLPRPAPQRCRRPAVEDGHGSIRSTPACAVRRAPGRALGTRRGAGGRRGGGLVDLRKRTGQTTGTARQLLVKIQRLLKIQGLVKIQRLVKIQFLVKTATGHNATTTRQRPRSPHAPPSAGETNEGRASASALHSARGRGRGGGRRAGQRTPP